MVILPSLHMKDMHPQTQLNAPNPEQQCSRSFWNRWQLAFEIYGTEYFDGIAMKIFELCTSAYNSLSRLFKGEGAHTWFCDCVLDC